MKCVVLAGGTGDRLWPLSRKNYPKQFLHYGADRSVFRDTIIRNMPFCDEFLITTRESYKSIIEGELNSFQGLSYRIVTEEDGIGTALSIREVLLNELKDLGLDDSLLLITSSDLLIEGNEYKDAIVKSKEHAACGHTVLFGVKPLDNRNSVGYFFSGDDERITEFIVKPTPKKAEEIYKEKNVFWNGGMILSSRDTLLSCFKENENIKGEIKKGTSVEEYIIKDNKNLYFVPLPVSWNDLSDYESYIRSMLREGKETYIKENSEGSVIINTEEERLLVLNNMKDCLVVNTADAVFISPLKDANDVRSIVSKEENKKRFNEYFEVNNKTYRPWGTREVINFGPGFRVRRVIIYPGMEIKTHAHMMRTENYSVVSGALSVEIEGESFKLNVGDSINIYPKRMHRLFNENDVSAVLIEVDTGQEIIEEKDMVVSNENEIPDVIPLYPAFKDYIWGGENIKKTYHLDAPKELDCIAEAWELSAHPDGESIISDGEFKGATFGEFIRKYKSAASGYKSEVFDRFPVLIKIIDAHDDLSVQIHPDDDYAFKNEGEFGKNEVWYVMESDKDSFIYCGLKEDTSRALIEEKIKRNEITELLNKIYVKKGDVIFVPAGTLHAIGKGIEILEIQQNSNTTYRVYDYDRKDRDGNKRELNIKKAMDVVLEKAFKVKTGGLKKPVSHRGYTEQLLVLLKYFRCIKYDIDESLDITVDDSSFKSVVAVEGCGTMQVGKDEKIYDLKPGSSFFITSGKKLIHIKGKVVIVVTNI